MSDKQTDKAVEEIAENFFLGKCRENCPKDAYEKGEPLCARCFRRAKIKDILNIYKKQAIREFADKVKEEIDRTIKSYSPATNDSDGDVTSAIEQLEGRIFDLLKQEGIDE